MAAGKKLVILAAVNGGAQQDRDGARVPITPAEIAEAAHQCYKAGASVVHIHARAADKLPTSDIEVFSDIIKRIRNKCDIRLLDDERFRGPPCLGRTSRDLERQSARMERRIKAMAKGARTSGLVAKAMSQRLTKRVDRLEGRMTKIEEVE